MSQANRENIFCGVYVAVVMRVAVWTIPFADIQGIQVGTLFLSAEECPISDRYKQLLLDANDTATIVPVRSLRNPMLEQYVALEETNAPHEELEQLTVESLARAVYDGDIETGSCMAGEIAGIIGNIRPAKQIIEELFSEAEAVLAKLRIKY